MTLPPSSRQATHISVPEIRCSVNEATASVASIVDQQVEAGVPLGRILVGEECGGGGGGVDGGGCVGGNVVEVWW